MEVNTKKTKDYVQKDTTLKTKDWNYNEKNPLSDTNQTI